MSCHGERGGPYLRRREYPHPPPPSTSNTSRTIESVLSMTCLTSEGERKAPAVRRAFPDATTASPSAEPATSALSVGIRRSPSVPGSVIRRIHRAGDLSLARKDQSAVRSELGDR